MNQVRDAEGFLYNIGDVVIHKLYEGVPREELAERLMVVERIKRNYHNNTELRYYCRRAWLFPRYTIDNGGLIDFTEIELLPLPAPTPPAPTEPMS